MHFSAAVVYTKLRLVPCGEPELNFSQLLTRFCHQILNDSRCLRSFLRTHPNPLQLHLPSEPGRLPFGELPRASFDQLNGFSQRPFAAKVFHHLPISESLHRGFVFSQTALEQRLGLGHQAVSKHLLHSLINASVEFR